MIVDAFSRFNSWLRSPYSSEMTVLDWFLFVGLLAVALFVWSRIIRKVVD